MNYFIYKYVFLKLF